MTDDDKKTKEAFHSIGRCGICNAYISFDENWHELDCLVCESCYERCGEADFIDNDDCIQRR